MKKSSIVIALITVVGLISAGCVDNSELEPELISGIVTDIPWTTDSEFTGYVIQDCEGNNKGTVALIVRRGEGMYSLEQYYVFQEDIGCTAIVNVRADNLKPLAGGITMPNVAIAPVVTYSYEEKGKLNIDTSTIDRDQHVVINVPEDTYDDNELLFLLRAIPFETGFTASFTDVIPTSATNHPATITVIGEEMLQVPAGSFDAYKVELTIAEDKKYLWYGKDKPHYLLKMDDGTSIFLLKDIDTGVNP